MDIARQLIDDGFCVLEDMLDVAALQQTRDVSMEAVLALSKESLDGARAPGTLIDSGKVPGLADCIGNPMAMAALEAMGFRDIGFYTAVVISKPPGGPRLYGHQDCMMWDDPRAYSDFSPMIFHMYYLDDTNRENGCLRLIPGSHRKWHELHEAGTAHTADMKRAEDMDDPRFGDYLGEVDVPINAGDLLIGASRLFHSTHANTSDKHRTVITIWFHPSFHDLQETTQSWVYHEFHTLHDAWPADALKKISAMIPDYHGSAEPMELNRQPDRAKMTNRNEAYRPGEPRSAFL